uniref:Origin recognition complex subunit 4 n=1 Tax=Strongyloides venezuelensis TaxID=75913 RepID=A0A0K0F5Z5_STRVS
MRILDNLKSFDKKLYGIDNQIKKLEGNINKFNSTNRGGSCLVVGPKGTGKTTSIQMITDMYQETIQTTFLDCNFLSNNATGLKMLAKLEGDQSYDDDDEPKIIVLENFEILSENRDQTLLYKLLNETRNRSWYVILVSDLRDVKNCLEKRVRSRVLNNEIVYINNLSFDEYLECFKSMLLDCLFGVDSSEKENISKKLFDMSKKRNKKIEKMIRRDDVIDNLTHLYYEDRSIITLKKIVITLVSKIYYQEKNEHEIKDESRIAEIPFLLFDTIKLFVPSINGNILKGLTIRQLCLLLCVVKLMKITQDIEFLYHNILKSYLRFKNTYDHQHRHRESDMDIYKELDTLVERGLIQYTNESQMGQLCFRRVRMGVDPVLVEKCIKEYKPLPSSVKIWLEDTIEMI